MENNLEPKKRGRPFKKKESQEEEKSSSALNDSQPVQGSHNVAEKVDMEAREIELGNEYEGLLATKSIYDIAADINKKHRDKHMAFVNREDASRAGQFWKYLQFTDGKTDVVEVDSIDKAYKTHWNVLCWRKKSIQDIVDREQARKQAEYNKRIESEEEYKKSVSGLDQSLRQINPDLRARAIGVSDF